MNELKMKKLDKYWVLKEVDSFEEASECSIPEFRWCITGEKLTTHPSGSYPDHWIKLVEL